MMKATLLCLAPILAARSTVSEDLVPAGSINGALAWRPQVVIVDDDPAIAAYAGEIRARFFPEARVLSGEQALEADLAGCNLLVYGTVAGNAWLHEYEARLPVRFVDGGLLLQERRFEGEHLRAICAVRNPVDRARRAVVYAAAIPEQVVGINSMFHGPTEWVVADGARLLASGSFVSKGPLAVEAMSADLDFLVETLSAVHPTTVEGLPRKVERAVRTARAAIGEPLTREQFWFAANGVLLALGDAHTGMTPLSAGPSIDLPLRWLRDGLIVAHDTALLRKGDLVLEIGGVSPDALLAGLGSLIPAETPWWIRRGGERALTSAGNLESLGARVDAGVQVRVERAGESLELDLPLGESVQPAPREAWARFEIDPEHGLGVFTLDRCQVDDFYRARLREFFTAVTGQGIGRIVIDVRANSGGNSSVVDEFLRYLAVESYRTYSGAIRVSAQSREQRRDNGYDLGYHEFPVGEKDSQPMEDLPPFGGEVFVLTSNATFSSGNWFAVLIHDNGIGQVVGEPTGNAPSSYGDLLRFDLPRTSLSLGMSYKRWIRPDPTRDPATCLEPDILVPLTRADVIAGRDPVLEYLRSLE